MTFSSITPDQLYYHFKRDPDQGLEHGAYLVLGIGKDTEDRSKHYVITKPLYYCNPRHLDERDVSYLCRPIEYFNGEVTRDNYQGPRFSLITDQKIINYLLQRPLYSSPYLDN
jgi:hypothetical protein